MHTRWFADPAEGERLDETLLRLVGAVSRMLDGLDSPAVAPGTGRIDVAASAVVLPHAGVPGCSLVAQVAAWSSSVGCWWSVGPTRGPARPTWSCPPSSRSSRTAPPGPRPGSSGSWSARWSPGPGATGWHAAGSGRWCWTTATSCLSATAGSPAGTARARAARPSLGCSRGPGPGCWAWPRPPRWPAGLWSPSAPSSSSHPGPTRPCEPGPGRVGRPAGLVLGRRSAASGQVRTPMLAGLLLVTLGAGLALLLGPADPAVPTDSAWAGLGLFLRNSYQSLFGVAALACYLFAFRALPGRAAPRPPGRAPSRSPPVWPGASTWPLGCPGWPGTCPPRARRPDLVRRPGVGHAGRRRRAGHRAGVRRPRPPPRPVTAGGRAGLAGASCWRWPGRWRSRSGAASCYRTCPGPGAHALRRPHRPGRLRRHRPAGGRRRRPAGVQGRRQPQAERGHDQVGGVRG